MQSHDVCLHQGMSHSTCASQVCPRAGYCLVLQGCVCSPGRLQLPQIHMIQPAAPRGNYSHPWTAGWGGNTGPGTSLEVGLALAQGHSSFRTAAPSFLITAVLLEQHPDLLWPGTASTGVTRVHPASTQVTPTPRNSSGSTACTRVHTHHTHRTAHTQVHMCTYTHTYTTHTAAHTCAHVPTYAHTQTHAHTHMHTYSRVHTHRQALPSAAQWELLVPGIQRDEGADSSLARLPGWFGWEGTFKCPLGQTPQ